jgi:hypothetical protein
MKTALRVFVLLAASALAFAEDKGGFKSSDFFKAYAGEWEMTGELQKGDGGVIKIKESWKAEFQGDDTLNIEGKRELDGNSQDFVWTMTHNPATGLYEASHRAKDSGDAIRFEVSLSETEMKIEMTALLGNNSKIAITDAFADKEHDTIESKITMTDDNGATTLSGTLTHKRVKKP